MKSNKSWLWAIVVTMLFVSITVHAATGKGLRVAAKNGDIETVKQLLSKGVDANSAGKKGGTPLIKAAKGNYIDIVQLLLFHGADPKQQNKKGRSAMDVAESNEYHEIIAIMTHALAEQAVTLGVKPMSHEEFGKLMREVLQRRGWQIEKSEKFKLTAVYKRKKRAFKVEASLHDNRITIRFIKGYGSKRLNYLNNLRKDLLVRL